MTTVAGRHLVPVTGKASATRPARIRCGMQPTARLEQKSDPPASYPPRGAIGTTQMHMLTTYLPKVVHLLSSCRRLKSEHMKLRGGDACGWVIHSATFVALR